MATFAPVHETRTLSTNPVRLFEASDGRTVVLVTNEDAGINVRLGSREVSTTKGFLLKPGRAIALDKWRGELWAVAESGTPQVSTLADCECPAGEWVAEPRTPDEEEEQHTPAGQPWFWWLR